MVSLVPFKKVLVKTVTAYQFVVVRLVEYSGLTLQVLVPVERRTTLLLRDRLRIRIVGGGGGVGSTVRI